MWCSLCRTDVSVRTTGHAGGLLCSRCGHDLLTTPKPNDAIRQAREILERWNSSDLFERISRTESLDALPPRFNAILKPGSLENSLNANLLESASPKHARARTTEESVEMNPPEPEATDFHPAPETSAPSLEDNISIADVGCDTTAATSPIPDPELLENNFDDAPKDTSNLLDLPDIEQALEESPYEERTTDALGSNDTEPDGPDADALTIDAADADTLNAETRAQVDLQNEAVANTTETAAEVPLPESISGKTADEIEFSDDVGFASTDVVLEETALPDADASPETQSSELILIESTDSDHDRLASDDDNDESEDDMALMESESIPDESYEADPNSQDTSDPELIFDENESEAAQLNTVRATRHDEIVSSPAMPRLFDLSELTHVGVIGVTTVTNVRKISPRDPETSVPTEAPQLLLPAPSADIVDCEDSEPGGPKPAETANVVQLPSVAVPTKISRSTMRRPLLHRRFQMERPATTSSTGSDTVNRNLRVDQPGGSDIAPEVAHQDKTVSSSVAPETKIVSNSPKPGKRFRIDAAESMDSVTGTDGRRHRTQTLPKQRYIDDAHESTLRGPHFEVTAPRRSNLTSATGQFLAYLGVLGLTIGTAMVIYGHFGGYSEYTPTGWLVTTVAQMLLFLGVINLVSGGIEQNNEDVSRRINTLGEQLIRIEQVTSEVLRGPKISPRRYDNPDAEVGESTREIAGMDRE